MLLSKASRELWTGNGNSNVVRLTLRALGLFGGGVETESRAFEANVDGERCYSGVVQEGRGGGELETNRGKEEWKDEEEERRRRWEGEGGPEAVVRGATIDISSLPVKQPSQDLQPS
ncbi:hypothetical protein V1477_016308 [Vespula maculifrons]|uniref:Uncharacterized protein n=1 Tax=Vespula maculifrons TaxID=7453 RepID=A0ABD2BCN3_VESMC